MGGMLWQLLYVSDVLCDKDEGGKDGRDVLYVPDVLYDKELRMKEERMEGMFCMYRMFYI